MRKPYPFGDRIGLYQLPKWGPSAILAETHVRVAFGEGPVRRIPANQPLSYPIRLPDRVQEDALRLLDFTREVINATVAALWPQLDAFGTRDSPYAYKQVTALIGPGDAHGDRQWRCEAEQAGRILRGQAQRKKQFERILPLLSAGMIEPNTESKPAGKNRKAIKQAIVDLREGDADGGSAVELQSLIEQCCNFYLKQGCFPAFYEEMQPIPVLKVGILPYAADDGGDKGQAYHLRLDPQKRVIFFAFRFPDAAGRWTRKWAEPEMALTLPDALVERLQGGTPLAPLLRESPNRTGRATRCSISSSRFPSPLWLSPCRSSGCSGGIGE
jgi:putative transposase